MIYYFYINRDKGLYNEKIFIILNYAYSIYIYSAFYC